ncbi:unnamed protein product, partial [Chrysoparadoxa australica]
ALVKVSGKLGLDQCPHNALAGPDCLNGEIHVFQGEDKPPHPSSCSTCDCDEGWGGLNCGLCEDVAACPVQGGRTAVKCSNDQLTPTAEEARHEHGKMISCSCGGGEDVWSQALCDGQPGTMSMFHMYGIGTPEDPMTIELTELAATRRLQDESWPGQYDYAYPKVFNATLHNCIVTKGYCLDIAMTDVAKHECTVISCHGVESECPPSGLDQCEGFPDCVNPDNGNAYWTHKCNAIPQTDAKFRITCELERNDEGNFICYFEEEGGFAALSLTCQTGQCLYGDNVVPAVIPMEVITRSSLSILEQEMVLLVMALLPLIAFAHLLSTSRKSAYGRSHTPRGKHQPLLNISDLEDADSMEGCHHGKDGLASAGGVSEGAMEGLVGLLDGWKDEGGRQPHGHGARRLLREGITLSWEDLSYRVGMQEVSAPAPLPNNLCSPTGNHGFCTAGSFTALMGPSGAGKTTLLDLLAGRKRAGDGSMSGKIKVNGHCFSGSDIRAISGYVTQEDMLPGMMTVYEHLMFHAMLRMPKDVSDVERRSRVLEVIDELALTKVADSLVGNEFQRGISGGEKRRVSVAAELLTCPALLFLDEPSTGLDSSNALRLMQLIKNIADRGTTVLASIHQPRQDIFDMFGRVVLLNHGSLAYFGPPSSCTTYFASVGMPLDPAIPNPADAMLDLCLASSAARVAAETAVEQTRRGGVRDLGIAFKETCPPSTFHVGPVYDGSYGDGSCGKPRVPKVPLTCPLGPFVLRTLVPQYSSSLMIVLFIRSITELLLLTFATHSAARHPLLLVLQFGGAAALSLLLGTLFQGQLSFDLSGAQDRFGLLFFLLVSLALLSLSSLPVWQEKHCLFIAESTAAGGAGLYTHAPYFGAVVFFDLILVRAVPPLFFAFATYVIAGLNTSPEGENCLLWFALILLLTNVAMSITAMGIGASGLTLPVSNLIGAMVALAFCLLGKFLANSTHLSKLSQLLASFTPLGYSFEALLINEFSDKAGTRPFIIEGRHCSPDLPLVMPLGPEILRAFDLSSSGHALSRDVALLATLTTVYLAASFVVFYLTTTKGSLTSKTDPAEKANLSARDTSRKLRATSMLSLIKIALSLIPLTPQLQPGVSVGTGSENELLRPLHIEMENSKSALSATVGGVLTPVHSSSSIPGKTSTSTGWGLLGNTYQYQCAHHLTIHLLTHSHVLSSGSFNLNASICPFLNSLLYSTHRSAPAFSWHNISYVIKSPVEKHILHNVSGSAKPSNAAFGNGCVTAIMGPSGAGKTTLLDILAGRLVKGTKCAGEVHGTIHVNGKSLPAEEIRALSGYVAQRDVLPEIMTVYEHLMFHAMLRMPKDVSDVERRSRVLEVIGDLGLSEVQDSLIGGDFQRGISGGEKRRVSVAAELLTCPALLFLDEPSTGLDSSNALRLMQLIKNIADRGTTVLAR